MYRLAIVIVHMEKGETMTNIELLLTIASTLLIMINLFIVIYNAFIRK